MRPTKPTVQNMHLDILNKARGPHKIPAPSEPPHSPAHMGTPRRFYDEAIRSNLRSEFVLDRRVDRKSVRSNLLLKTRTKNGDANDAEEATGARIIALADRRHIPRPGLAYAQAMAGQSVKIGARAFDAIAFLQRQFEQTR
jgi:hypothetical protein